MTVSSFSQSDGIDFDCGPNVTFSFNSQPAGEVNGYSYWTGGTDNVTNDTYVLFVQFVNNEPRWEVHVDLGFAVDEFDAPVAGTFGILYFYSNVFNGVSPSCDVDWIVDSLVVNDFPCTSLTATCLGGPIGNCLTYYVDEDFDDYGSALDLVGEEFCSDPGDGWSLTNNDCDDFQNDVYPGALEICDGLDNDCDGEVDENITDCNNGVILEYCNDAKTKILVCHNGKDICVSINALDAHEAHGDYLGSCANAREGDFLAERPTSYDLVSWPNPTNDVFNVRMITPNYEDKVNLQAYDINGRLIYADTINGNEDYQFGHNLQAGIYFVKVTQAENTQVLKVIKQ